MSTAPATSAAIPSAGGWLSRAGWVTTGAVASRLNYSDRHVRRLCEAGKIPGARRLGKSGDWRIPREWLQAQLLPVIRRKPG